VIRVLLQVVEVNDIPVASQIDVDAVAVTAGGIVADGVVSREVSQIYSKSVVSGRIALQGVIAGEVEVDSVTLVL
jgi:hypothetical protein